MKHKILVFIVPSSELFITYV